MKQKKEFKYRLKKDVRDDLENLASKINFLLMKDRNFIYPENIGFDSIPSCSILPAFFKVYSHLFWNRTFESWFKKVYE